MATGWHSSPTMVAKQVSMNCTKPFDLRPLSVRCGLMLVAAKRREAAMLEFEEIVLHLHP